ncbi:hypothetical protein NC651_026467 [Populus alba x Populus x berolinensis]|nr:hypothetical protein NC651_026467 [Populus alba x Populus x berolinensis]
MSGPRKMFSSVFTMVIAWRMRLSTDRPTLAGLRICTTVRISRQHLARRSHLHSLVHNET